MRISQIKLIGLITLAVFTCGKAVPALALRPVQTVETTVAAAIGAANSSGGIRAEFEQKRMSLGGKGAWDQIVRQLAGKTGFKTIDPVRYITIQELWAEFIKANKELVDEGNRNPSPENRHRLIARFRFPNGLKELIAGRVKDMDGEIIIRSSGTWEDNYEQNLAGLFKSVKVSDPRLAVDAVSEIFEDAINTIWLNQEIAGLPDTLSAEEGIGLVIQLFLSFDASGTAMSNRHGYTTIEAVIGDAVTAVMPRAANITQFLFEKGQKGAFEHNPAFVDTPYEFVLRGKRYCKEENPEEMALVLEGYPKINNRFSPITEEQAIELNRVVNALEEEIGAPVDVEWGFLDGKLYIIQMRPVPRDAIAIEPLVMKGRELEGKTLIATTPTASGQTGPGGFTGKMVLFGRVDKETVQRFEQEFSMSYIRMQDDVASQILGKATTLAKVLVDISQSGTQAHNFKLIEPRVMQGEFCYANSPILREGLEQNIEFIPHSEIKGVWVSRQDVTYFGDGLRGSFYAAVKGQGLHAEQDLTVLLSWREEKPAQKAEPEPSPAPEPVAAPPEYPEKLRVLYANDQKGFRVPFKAILIRDLGLTEVQSDSHYVGEGFEVLVAESIKQARKVLNLNEIDYVVTDWAFEDDNSARGTLSNGSCARGIMRHCREKKIKWVDVDTAYEQYLSDAKGQFPDLNINGFPDMREDRVNRLRRIRQQQVEAYEQELAAWQAAHPPADAPEPAAAPPEYPEKLRVLYVNDSVDYCDNFQGILTKGLGLSKDGENHYTGRYLEVFVAKDIGSAYEVLDSEEIDYVVSDWVFGDDSIFATVSFADGIMRRCLRKGIGWVDIETRYDEHISTARGRYAALSINAFPTVRGGGDQAARIRQVRQQQVEAYEQELAAWQAAHPEEAAKLAAAPPEYPERLNVLYVNDNESLRTIFATLFMETLGLNEQEDGYYLGEEMKVFITAGPNEACGVLDLLEIDYVITDWTFEYKYVTAEDGVAVFEGGDAKAILSKCQEQGIKWVDIQTVYERYFSDAQESYPDLNITRFLIQDGEWLLRFRQVRRQQIEAYEQELAAWQAAHPEEAAKPAEAVAGAQVETVFIVTGHAQEAGYLKEFIGERFGERFKFVYIDSMWNLGRKLAEQAPQLVITDTVLDNRDALDDILDQVRAANPDAKFIVAGTGTALLDPQQLQDRGVIGIFQRPWYFDDAIELLLAQPEVAAGVAGSVTIMPAASQAERDL